jgi:hypothetical protein
VLGSDESTPSLGHNPPYQESNDITSATNDDDGGDGASEYCISPSGGGTQFTGAKVHTMLHIFTTTFCRSLKVYLIFLEDVDFTHVTQDQDHGAPASQRLTMTVADRGRGRGRSRQHHPSLSHSNSSIHIGSESSSSYAHGYFEYLTPDPSTTIYDVHWVYEWENSITCWCPNGKQLPNGWGKLEKSTSQACWLLGGSC